MAEMIPSWLIRRTSRLDPKRGSLCCLPLPSLLFLVLLVAVFLGHERVFSMLQQGKTTLLNRGELVLGSVSLGLGGYLSWQGITGLALR